MQTTIELTGGIVAHNEEAMIQSAVRSLLDQELPVSARWREVWVVVSGCTDGTADRVRELAQFDPRIRLVEQEERRGKADALNAIFARAHGDCLVLLNGDAVAEPGAVLALLRGARGLTAPFAVMGNPVAPSAPRTSALGGTLSLLWNVHEEVHRETLGEGQGNHLSDELLLLSLPVVDHLSSGTINDGAFLGALLTLRGGSCRFAVGGRVRIQVPATIGDYLTQRRRIYVGHARVARETRVVPTTLFSLALRQPKRAWQVVGRCWETNPHRDRWTMLVILEVVSMGLALWDALPPRPDRVRWKRVRPSPGWERGSGPGSSRT